MIGRRRLLALTLLLAACGSTDERGDVLDPLLIVPGVRVGPYVLGVTTRDQTEARRAQADGLAFEFQGAPGLARGLTGVLVTDPRYRTADGLGVGSRVAEVRRALGVPLRPEIGARESGAAAEPAEGLAYDGVRFGLDGERVVSVLVRRP